MSRFSRPRYRFASGIGLAALLVAMLPAASLAGPRLVFFGSVTDGTIYLSPVQTGAQSLFRLTLTNLSNQTLNHATVYVGSTSTSSVLAGATIADVSAETGACSFTATGLTCDFSQLKTRETHTFSVLLTPTGAAGSTISVDAVVQINEAQGTQNVDTFHATGSTTVFAPSADRFGVVLGAGTDLAGATDFGLNGLKVGFSAGHAAAGLNVLSIDDNSGLTVDCGSKTCIGSTIALAANFGDALDPYGVLTLTWTDKSVKFAGLLHVLDDGSTVDIANTKANVCKTNTQVNCVETSKAGLLVVRVPQNGLIKGYK